MSAECMYIWNMRKIYIIFIVIINTSQSLSFLLLTFRPSNRCLRMNFTKKSHWWKQQIPHRYRLSSSKNYLETVFPDEAISTGPDDVELPGAYDMWRNRCVFLSRTHGCGNRTDENKNRVSSIRLLRWKSKIVFVLYNFNFNYYNL